MSHSQFHSTNLFILRHAWLNLWDKHMTTGRINQVTTFHLHTSQGTWSKRPLLMVNNHFRSREFIINGWKIQLQPRNAFHSVLTKSEPTNETPCSPISQISDTLLPVETTRIMAFRENYTQPAGHPKDIPSTVMADPQVVMCNRFSYQQVIHILPPLQAPKWVLDSERQRQVKPIKLPGSNLSQVSVPCQTGASITRSKTSQSSLNPCRRHTRHSHLCDQMTTPSTS